MPFLRDLKDFQAMMKSEMTKNTPAINCAMSSLSGPIGKKPPVRYLGASKKIMIESENHTSANFIQVFTISCPEKDRNNITRYIEREKEKTNVPKSVK